MRFATWLAACVLSMPGVVTLAGMALAGPPGAPEEVGDAGEILFNGMVGGCCLDICGEKDAGGPSHDVHRSARAQTREPTAAALAVPDGIVVFALRTPSLKAELIRLEGRAGVGYWRRGDGPDMFEVVVETVDVLDVEHRIGGLAELRLAVSQPDALLLALSGDRWDLEAFSPRSRAPQSAWQVLEPVPFRYDVTGAPDD